MLMDYIILCDNGFEHPPTYFWADSFWPSRENATSFPSRETAERHTMIIAKGDAMNKPTDLSLYSVVPR